MARALARAAAAANTPVRRYDFDPFLVRHYLIARATRRKVGKGAAPIRTRGQIVDAPCPRRERRAILPTLRGVAALPQDILKPRMFHELLCDRIDVARRDARGDRDVGWTNSDDAE
jgi:hypothetical protein